MKILIVDDHALFREGLTHVLQNLEKRATILEASDYEQALQHISTNPGLDLVLLDIKLPGKNGFELLSSITRQYSALPVVILSASTKRSDLQQALDLGAMGYIPKETTSSNMYDAIKLILSGGIYVPQSIGFINDCNNFVSGSNNNYVFTPRQLDVLTLLIDGYSNKHIAQELQLAEATIKVHITSILKTLGVNNRTQAAMMATQLGLAASDR